MDGAWNFESRISRRLDWLLPSWLEDSSAYDQSINEDMKTVYYTVAVNLVICSVCVVFFSVYRRHNLSIYAPKADMFPDQVPPVLSTDSLFGWMRELYNIPDEVLLEKAGFDTLFLVRFYRISFKIFFFFAIYAWGVLLPINGTGDSDTDDNSFGLWSMTNVEQGSSKCWFHVAGVYLMTIIMIYFLEKEFVIYAKHRHNYLRQRHAHLRTVLVEGIPSKLRSTVTLATYLETMYPNAILSVRLGQNLRPLENLIAQRLEALSQLERCLYTQHLYNYRPTVKPANLLREVDAIRYYSQQLDELNEKVCEEQLVARRRANHEDFECGKTAIEVIEDFLRVTEIGSVTKMLRERSGGAEKWMRRSSNKSSTSTSTSRDNLTAASVSVLHPAVSTSRRASSSSSSSRSSKLGHKKSSTSTKKKKTSVSTGYGSVDAVVHKEVEEEGEEVNEQSSLLHSEDEQSDEYDLRYEDIYHHHPAAPSSPSTKKEGGGGGGEEDGLIDENNNGTSTSTSVGGAVSGSTKAATRRRLAVAKQPAVGSDRAAFDEEEDDVSDNNDNDNDNDHSAPRRSRHSYSLYHLSWSDWVWSMLSAESLADCWRRYKEGRHVEDFGEPPEGGERSTLISLPEERKLFLSKAFVTFKTFTAATIARQVVHMQLAGRMAISEAPHPSDITWMNMYATRTGLFWRRLFVETAVILLIIVWVAPVTLISFVVSEDALRDFFPWVDELCAKSDWFESLVELLQPGALVAIMNLLPPILSGLAVLEGCISYSSNQFRSFDRYFTFQIINVFLVTTIAGSVIDAIKDIYLDPTATFRLLGESLPKMGGYFTNYMIIKAFIGLGMEIMRFPAMFSALLKYLLTPNLTLRDRRLAPLFGGLRHMLNPGNFAYAKIYAQDILQVVLCATYACIAPLTLVGGLCYFGFASLIYKHQMLYVYEPVFETGGQWWPKMARCFVVALLFAQCTMVGMLILKETSLEIYFMAFLVVLTAFYYWRVASTYVPLAAQLPFDMATSLDLDQQKYHDELAGAEGYIQPALRAGIMKPELEFNSTDKDKSDATCLDKVNSVAMRVQRA